MAASAIVRRRQMLALPLLALVFVGVPVLIAGYLMVVELGAARRGGGQINWGVPATYGVVLGMGLIMWAFSRHRPGTWAHQGFYFGVAGALPAMATVLYASTRGIDIVLGVLIQFVAPIVAYIGLGTLAYRVLTFPVVEELADSRYEWTVPLRGLPRVALTIGTGEIGVVQHEAVVWWFLQLSPVAHRWRRPLAAVDMVWDATTNGFAPLILPKGIEVASGATTGPAVGVRVGKHTWVLPVDDAQQVIRLLERRIAMKAARAI